MAEPGKVKRKRLPWFSQKDEEREAEEAARLKARERANEDEGTEESTEQEFYDKLYRSQDAGELSTARIKTSKRTIDAFYHATVAYMKAVKAQMNQQFIAM